MVLNTSPGRSAAMRTPVISAPMWPAMRRMSMAAALVDMSLPSAGRAARPAGRAWPLS